MAEVNAKRRGLARCFYLSFAAVGFLTVGLQVFFIVFLTLVKKYVADSKLKNLSTPHKFLNFS